MNNIQIAEQLREIIEELEAGSSITHDPFTGVELTEFAAPEFKKVAGETPQQERARHRRWKQTVYSPAFNEWAEQFSDAGRTIMENREGFSGYYLNGKWVPEQYLLTDMVKDMGISIKQLIDNINAGDIPDANPKTGKKLTGIELNKFRQGLRQMIFGHFMRTRNGAVPGDAWAAMHKLPTLTNKNG